jgi:subtilisin family serine protease
VAKTQRQAAQREFARRRVAVREEIPQLGVHAISVPASEAADVMRSLMDTGLFTYAEPEGFVTATAIPNDPDFSSQWHLGAISAAAAWNITTGVASVPIAMIDSGVDPTHPDIASKLIPGWNFVASSSNTADNTGHGTATAGTAAAASNNGLGVTGVAWLNPIMPLVVIDATGSGPYSNVASAITYAADHGARIINISLAGTTPSSTLQSAVNYAWSKGAVIFAAAGNSSSTSPVYPAACDNVVAISATEPGDTLASFSDYGSWIDLSAPGDNILTTTNGGGYGSWYGTSFSSPIVAATAALALSVNPNLSAQGLVNLMEQNSDDIGAAGYDTSFGWGRVNAYKVAVAASASKSADTIAPTVAISSPASGSTVSGTVTITGSATDNVGVTRVELWIDNLLNSTCSSTAFSCSWNTAAADAGSHTVTVKAYDAAGNAGSASESLVVPAPPALSTAPLTVQIAKPLSGSSVTGNTAVTASASDSVKITQICFFVDGVLKATDGASPASYNWNTKKVSNGSHTLTVKAWDVAGNTALASIVVNVQ